MLVCNVSMVPRRAALLADLAEAASADDAPTTGTVFAALVDDPASALDNCDAYFGAIMAEAANAADNFDATIGLITTVTWNPSDKSANIVLTSGNLTAAISAAGDNGVRATTSRTSGKFYFELTSDTSTTGNGADTGIGIGTSTAGLTTVGSNALNACLAYLDGGSCYYNGGPSAKTLGGSIVAGGQVCVAIDLDNKRIWMRLNASAWWNDGAANPVTNTNGLDISSLFTSNAAYPLVSCNSTTPHLTANFGATTFAQTMPSGFAAWQS